MLETLSLDDPQVKQWDDFVVSHPDGTPYHLSNWLRTIHETYSFKPYMHIGREKNGEINYVLPAFLIKRYFTKSRFISLPFSDYGGPLFSEQSLEKRIIDDLLRTQAKSAKYIEVRSPLRERGDFVCFNYYKRHILNLEEGLQSIRKKMNKKTIVYNIRKAEKAGIEIKEENNTIGLDGFYKLNAMTRKKHGVPSQPKKFFDNLLKFMISKGHGFILLAYYDSKIIGSSLFLTVGDQMHYKYNASDPAYLKKASPNHALTWYAIKKGVEEGYRSLDFGRTSQDNKGLIRYKEMWGMKSIDLPYYYYPQIVGSASTAESGFFYRLLTNTWRALPDVFAERMSQVIYKYIA